MRRRPHPSAPRATARATGADAPPAPPPAVDDPDFAAVVAAWPTLSVAIRAGILAMVRAVTDPTLTGSSPARSPRHATQHHRFDARGPVARRRTP